MQVTKRELEILLLGAEGLTDKEIAVRLSVSPATVASHWVNMRGKLDASNRGQIIAKAMSVIYRQTYEELSQANAMFRLIVDTLEDFAIFMMDLDRCATSWNPGVGRVMGYSEDEWIGRSGDIIFTPEDIEKGAPDEEQARADRDGRATDVRWHVRKDGTRFWTLGVLIPLRTEEGETICYAKVLRDNTRLKRLEEEISRLGGDPASIS